jgi:hypothetical protein
MEKSELGRLLTKQTRDVKYGRIDNVVILVFPDNVSAFEWATRLETEKMLKGTKIDSSVRAKVARTIV